MLHKMPTQSISRRRGTAKSKKRSSDPLYNPLLLLGCIALSLCIGLVGLFYFHMPVPPTIAARLSKDSAASLHGIPNLLRGNIPPVPVPKSEDQQEQKTQVDDDPTGGSEDEEEEDKKLLDDDVEKNPIDEPEVLDDDVEKNLTKDEPAVNNLNRQEGIQKRLTDRHQKRGADANAAHLPFDTPPQNNFPYPIESPPANYDIARDFSVIGGNRFTEYTTGGTPYRYEHMQAQSDTVARVRRGFVKRAMQFAWNGYTKYAYGKDEVLPQSKAGSNNWGGQGILLVDSLDTLWLMGMKDEFWKARDWVRDHLDHASVGTVSVFETTIRDLGGLLAAYDWSGDKVFLDKAEDLGVRLLHCFDGSSSGIPYGQVNLNDGSNMNLGWTGGAALVAEAGTLQIEFRYLAHATGKPQYAEKIEKVFKVLKDIAPADGLYPYEIENNPSDGVPKFRNAKVTFGAMGDSLYEYMLKVWIQGGMQEPMYREMYDLAIDSMHKQLLHFSTPSGLAYIADRNSGTLDHKMDHLVCFMGGALALGAYLDPLGLDSERAQRDLRTGKALTYTCYQMYARMNTGISAEFIQFYDGQDFQIGRGAPHYLLRPEAVESLFILNQLTGDPIYREWGWEMFQAIEKYCKTEIAYGALSNVQNTNGRPRDKMESFFLAETLKYFYLLFDPDTEVDLLHKHVFNTEAHPLRIFPEFDKKVS
jgi:mannosyl-oligosaccharide alpha-1,2-mannosidase